MKELLIRGGQIVTANEIYRADLYVKNGQIHFVRSSTVGQGNYKRKRQKSYQTETIIDARGCYVTSGLFDLQVNGSTTCDLWADPNANQFNALCQTLLEAGVTAFLPTLITDELRHLNKNIAFLESMGVTGQLASICQEKAGKFNASELITMPGIHLEGPFLSPEKPGVHPKQYIKPLQLSQLQGLARPSVKLLTLAPELSNGEKSVA